MTEKLFTGMLRINQTTNQLLNNDSIVTNLITYLTTLCPIKALIPNNTLNYLLKYCKSNYSTLTVITYQSQMTMTSINLINLCKLQIYYINIVRFRDDSLTS